MNHWLFFVVAILVVEKFDYKHHDYGICSRNFGGDSVYCYRSTFDANGNRLSQAWYYDIGNGFQPDFRITYTYNTLNKLIYSLGEGWENNTWVNNSNETTTYDVNQNPFLVVRQNWIASIWEDSYRTTNSFNANNLTTNSLSESSFLGTWQKSSKDSNVYSNGGDLEYYLSQSWSDTAWRLSQQSFFTHDDNHNQTSGLSQNWTAGAWFTYYISRTTYDDNNFIEGYSYILMGPNWVNLTGGDSTHYYFHTVTGFHKQKTASAILVYPNPANGSLNIQAENQIEGIEIYNQLGERVKEVNTIQSTEARFQVNLPKGIYLLKVRTADKVYTNRIVFE